MTANELRKVSSGGIFRIRETVMRLVLVRPVLVLGLAVSTLSLGACFSSSTELTQQAACEFHNQNDPVERDRCRLPPDARNGTVPDVRPQDLPVRTGQPSD
jgi:hypothetical protein